MATRTIYGQVESNGNVLEGAGFQSARVSAGVYTIEFSQDFTSVPAVNITPIGFDNNAYNIRHVFIKAPSSGGVSCISSTHLRRLHPRTADSISLRSEKIST
jgi:hypothetical protein